MPASTPHTLRAAARRAVLAVVSAVVALLLAVAPPTNLLATAHAEAEVCAAQKAALAADIQAIEEHNSRQPAGGVGPPEIVIPYNQEAVALDARRNADKAQLVSCLAVQKRLNPGGIQVTPLSESLRQALEQARRQTPPGWQAPTPMMRHPWNKNVVMPKDSPAKPVYDAVRGKTPVEMPADAKLQGTARPQVGAPVAGAPGRVIGHKADGTPNVSADHIVPLVELVQLPRFMELNADNMWSVINAPLNLQWLDPALNKKKGSRSVGDMVGVDEKWVERQTQLQDQKRQELIDIIAQLANSQIG